VSGNETVGRTLVACICLFMFLGGIVLFIADRLGLGVRVRQEHRRRPCRERATAHRSCGFAAVTDSVIYLRHLSHELMSAGTMWAMASTSDRARVILVAVTAVAQAVTAPVTTWTLGPSFNIGAISDANISPVTPADYAFAVWD
jgi:hypothetical protein